MQVALLHGGQYKKKSRIAYDGRSVVGMTPSQLALMSTRSHFGQFVLIDVVNSYSFGQFVLIVCSIYTHSFWLIRAHNFGQSVLTLEPLFLDICLSER